MIVIEINQFIDQQLILWDNNRLTSEIDASPGWLVAGLWGPLD